MDHALRFLLAELRREWLALPDHAQRAGTWIRRLPPMPPAYMPPPGQDGAPQQVWFLDPAGQLQERGLDAYRRFAAVLLLRPWSSGRPPAEPLGNVRPGLATVAPVVGAQDWYLEYQWDDRLGAGFRYHFDEAGLCVEPRRNLWLS